MVSISKVKAANAALRSTYPAGSIAVFVGGTSGLGEAAMKQLATIAPEPVIYFVGRSQSRADVILGELKACNPQGRYEFLQADLQRLAAVKTVCQQIKDKESKVDLLVASTGSFNLDRADTPDDLPLMLALDYHVRFCFAANLLPLLSAAPAARVISIFGPGKEQKINKEDMELKTHYSLAQSKLQGIMLTSMAITELASEYPGIAWIHLWPGIVMTPFYDVIPGVTGFLIRWIVNPLCWPFSTTVEESSQRALYAATAPQFSKGAFRIGAKSVLVPESAAMIEYKRENMQSKFWKHTLQLYEKAGAL